MKHKMKEKALSLLVVILTAIFSYGYTVTHFAIGVDDTAMSLYFEEGLSVCTNRWTLFFLNRVLNLNIISWPTWIVETLAVCFLAISFSLWCLLLKKVLLSLSIKLPDWFYGMAIAIGISCPILSELWVYYMHNGMSMAYGLTALALLLFLKSLEWRNGKWLPFDIIGSGVCLATAIGCYETMMDCFLIGAIMCYMILHAFSEKRKNVIYDIRFLPWSIRGCVVLAISLILRVIIHKFLMSVYQLKNLAKYGVNDYNSLFGDLLVTPGAIGMLVKRMYLRYFVNAVAYLPITFLVFAGIVIGIFAIYFTIKRKNLWVLVCVPAMGIVPIMSSIVAGRAKSYHSAQFVPIVIMVAFILLCVVSYLWKGLFAKIVKTIMILIAFSAIVIQTQEINKWFQHDYRKFIEVKNIMSDIAEDLTENYDIQKPVVVVGALMPSGELCSEVAVTMNSWKYRAIIELTFFDPTIKEKYQKSLSGWCYYFADSPLLSFLSWAGTPFQNCDVAASQQYTNFWEMIGYHDFTYVSTVEMIEAAEVIRENLDMEEYPNEGYIVDNGDMLIINLSK